MVMTATLAHPVLPPAGERLLELIESREARVGVVGVGYVGLPFLLEKAKIGFNVTAIDRSPEKIAAILEGRSYIPDVPQDEFSKVVASGKVTATTNFDVVPELDVIVICVPTPLTKGFSPDLQYVEYVAGEIGARLRPGQMVSLESTTYPGTTDQIIAPILSKSGLTLGQDFFLAHSPERVNPGNKRYSTQNTSKVVGATDAASLYLAVTFYSKTILEVIPVSSSRAAEMVKVYENTFRAVNIALVNELALLCDRMQISVWEVLDAAFTKPFGIMPFYPGPGVGGHCIPIDPHYLEWKAREYNFSTHFIALAGEVNRRMPEFVIEKVTRILNNLKKPLRDSRILILGVAYKADIDDARESPAVEIIRELKARGAIVTYSDSFVPAITIDGERYVSRQFSHELLRGCNLAIIATAHSDVDYAAVVRCAPVVFDTRNATRGLTADSLYLL